MVVRRGATKRQASPMAERCTWWSMQSSMLDPACLAGCLRRDRGATSVRAGSRPPRRRRRRQDSCSPHPLRFTKQPSASWRNACRSSVPVLASAGCHIRSEAAVAGAPHYAQAGAPGAGLRSLPAAGSEAAKRNSGSVKPHAMHNHGELARHRHERALMTAFGRKAQALRLRGAVLLRFASSSRWRSLKSAVRTSPSPRREMCPS